MSIVSSSAIIYDGRKRVLLAQRSSNRSLDPNLWETIGGGIEFGESPEDCLRREIKEELGCDITITHLQLFNIYNLVKRIVDLFKREASKGKGSETFFL